MNHFTSTLLQEFCVLSNTDLEANQFPYLGIMNHFTSTLLQEFCVLSNTDLEANQFPYLVRYCRSSVLSNTDLEANQFPYLGIMNHFTSMLLQEFSVLSNTDLEANQFPYLGIMIQFGLTSETLMPGHLSHASHKTKWPNQGRYFYGLDLTLWGCKGPVCPRFGQQCRSIPAGSGTMRALHDCPMFMPSCTAQVVEADRFERVSSPPHK
ncbi:hypothetical protein J6590_043619 [Homalodisca vitripennis]|nr:hypothetical protein J6590_043619 [Homalodisca vitripennis]